MRRKTATHIQEFSDDVKNYIDRAANIGRFDLPNPSAEEDAEVGKILKDVALGTDMLAAIAKEVEFYIQGDIGRTTFLARYKALESEYATKLA